MKTYSHLTILASVSCALALSACDSIKDVPNEDAAGLPAQTVVLSGQINGLSSLRAITLQNNDDTINTKSFINAAPTVPNEGVRPVPFSFGTIDVGSAYNITVKEQPQFKNCVVVNGQGVLAVGVRPDVVVNCTNTGTRHDLTVNLPSNPAYFKGLAGAKVRVTTEEEIREVAIPANYTSNTVLFEDVLITAPGALNAAAWAVQATTFEGNRLNKCVVTSPSGTNPTGPVSTPVVGAVTGAAVDAQAPACQFTIGGRVGYSLPPGQTVAPSIAGLRLQLRDLGQNALEDLDIPTCNQPAPYTVANTTSTTTLGATVPQPTATTCSYQFTTPVRSSSTDGVYEVAVLQHPVDQFCIVTNGGSASVFTQGLVSPVNVQNANVFCRATPPATSRISGVFRLKETSFVSNVLTGTPPLVSSWVPFDFTQWNTASSNMMAFFDNGSIMYGAHANGAQVEHGFYDYNPAGQTLRFTSIVDTNTSTVFPANFNPVPTVAPTATFTTINNIVTTTTPGLSALPNPIRRNGATTVAASVSATANPFTANHAAMTGVTFGTTPITMEEGAQNVRTISGTFGADPLGIASAPTTNPGANYRVGWVLEEPPQVDTEMTGAWTTQDSRRLWVWDYRTYYGLAVGMLGGSPTMNDACFTIDDLHATGGIYTRRGSGTNCHPYSRPAADPVTGAAGTFGSGRNGPYAGYFAGTAEATDFSLSTAPLVQLPGFTGRIPGGEPAPGATSPSPIYFQVAPAASFSTTADPTYFPPASTSWCATEILGMRATANGFPINPPVYFCRTRATLP